MLYKVKRVYLWLIFLGGHHVLDKPIIYRITKECDLKPEVFIMKTDGKTSGIFRTSKPHRTLINAMKDIDFTKLGP